MLHLILQHSAKAAVISTAALTTLLLTPLSSHAQDLGTFGSGPFHSSIYGPDRRLNSRYDFDRFPVDLQSLGSDVICGNDIGRTRSLIRSRRFSTRRFFNRGYYYSANVLTDDPLVPNRLDAQRLDNRLLVGPAITNDPLVPNRLDSQPANLSAAELNSVSSPLDQSVNCQTIRNSSITTINQPLSNQSVSITINSGRPQSTASVPGNRSAGDGRLPLSAIANLPDGNYRVTSATDPRNDISTAELSNRGGRLFTFNKSGNTVTGNLNDFDSGLSACVTGSVEGDIVTGQAITDDLATDVLGRKYLDLGLALELGNQVGQNRYNNSVLNLSGFSRINAGEATPPTSC